MVRISSLKGLFFIQIHLLSKLFQTVKPDLISQPLPELPL